MNIQQFKYILAVAQARHFETAAQQCFVTQSTLSTMISKFEEEIGFKVFDRSKKPVEITLEGQVLIEQINIILKEIEQLTELTKEIKGEVSGNLTISVIPTVAPFLLPIFLDRFAKSVPKINIQVNELTTHEIIHKLKSRELDVGILSVPIQDKSLQEIVLYHEPFVYFDTKAKHCKNISINDIDITRLCVMEEGHCLRTQVIKICEIRSKRRPKSLNFEFKAGSIDSLLRFVKNNEAVTLLPYLSTLDFSKKDEKKVQSFSNPIPYRTIGLVVHKNFVKNKTLSLLQKSILDNINPLLPNKHLGYPEKIISPV